MNKSAKKSPKKVKTASSPKADTLVLNEPFFSTKRLFWIVGLVAFLVFANSISNGYNLDDELVTQNHPLTSRGLEAVGDIFTSPYYSDEMGYTYGYRPMVHLSFAIEHQFFGEKASISHFFNVILFALSAMLFFKLLLKIAGEKQLLFALLTTLFFVVHPIHTEVVDSIKNRDEILAFLFIIASGLSIFKYVEEGKWRSLFFILILFTMAMLSKKSVFPMVFILPTILVLTKDVTWKKWALVSLLIALPGAVIAGEFVLKSIFAFCLIPIIYFGALFLLKKHVLENEKFSFKLLFSNILVPLSGSLLVVLLFIFSKNFNWIPIALFFGLWMIFLNIKYGVVLSIFMLLVFDFYFKLGSLSLAAVFLSSFYFLAPFLKSKKFDPIVLISFLAFFSFLVFHHSFYQVFSVFFVLLISYLLFNRFLIPLFVVLVVLVSMIFFLKFNGSIPFLLLFVLTSLATFLLHKKSSFYLAIVQCLIFFGLVFANPNNRENFHNPFSSNEKSIALHDFASKYAITQTENALAKEGRMLEYMENTLVAPHSTSQTIGTGSQTLGEYLKLMVFPYELSFYYGYSKTSTVNLKNPWVWMSIFSHLFLVFLAFWQIKKRPFITIGIAWYLFSIILFSNWIELVAGMVGERLAFTASAGFCIFFVAIILWIRPSFSFRKPSWIEFAVGLVILLFLVKTVSRNSQWYNHLSLMKNDIHHLSNSAQANNLYASNLMKYAALDGSLSETERKAYQDEANVHFKRSVAIFPYFFNTQFDMARAAIMVGDTTVAINGYQKAIQIDPTFSDPYFYLLNIFALQKAEKPYLKLAKLLGANYGNFKLVDDRNKASLLLKDTSNFVASFKTQKAAVKSLLNNSLDSEAYFDLLSVYAQQNRGKDYLNTAKELSKIYNKSDLYEALAKGYFMTNQIDSAIYVLKQGIFLHPNVQSLRDNLREVEKFR